MPAAAREPSESSATDASLILALFLNHLEQIYPQPPAQAVLGKLRTELGEAARSGTVAQIRDKAAKQLDALVRFGETRRAGAGIANTGKSTHPTDPCTGLPLRIEAEELIRQVIEQRKQAYAVVFYLHRMALTNARFGEAIGNQVILFCSQHIATAILRSNDALFRWQGPAFVAVVERPESLQAVNSEIQRLATTPISRHFETPSRSVYLPIRLTSEVVPLSETNTADVLGQIGRFILNTSGQGQNEKDQNDKD
jgi:GGDEF domain-containing protein